MYVDDAVSIVDGFSDAGVMLQCEVVSENTVFISVISF